MTVAVRTCLALNRLFSRGPLARYGTTNVQQAASLSSCISDRVATVPACYELFRRFVSFDGCTVMELGCSRGYLLDALLGIEPFNAIGVDKDGEALADGAARYGNRIQFVQSSTTSIPLPGTSCDIAYTVDTIEHLSQPREIFQEIYRILRPGGRFLVYFYPWFSPYGPHLSEILPFPWPHVFFSMETLLEAAAQRHEDPSYSPPHYRIDKTTGQRKVGADNPYRSDWTYYLNREMTIHGFKKFLRGLPFRLEHFECLGFGGKTAPLARCLRPFASVPGLREFFSGPVFCVLVKPFD